MEKQCTARQATDDNIMRRMRIASWTPKATYTHSEYVILIVFPLKEWFNERASMLRLYIFLFCKLTNKSTIILQTATNDVLM